jgi:hypothetical protein
MTILEEKTFDKRDRAVKAARQMLGENATEDVEFELKRLENKRFYWAPIKIEQPKVKDRVYDISAKNVLGTVTVAGPSACEVKWDAPDPWGKVSNALTNSLRIVKATDKQPNNLDIPEFLKVENRKPLTPEQEARLKEIQQQKTQELVHLDLALPRNVEPAGLEILHAQQKNKRKDLKEQQQAINEQEIVSTSGFDAQPEEEDNIEMNEGLEINEEKAPKTKKLKKTKTAKPIKAKKTDGNDGKRVRDGAKTKEIGRLLQRKNGCTTAEILEATGWPSVSVPAMAKACGLTLRKEKNPGEKTRYWGE